MGFLGILLTSEKRCASINLFVENTSCRVLFSLCFLIFPALFLSAESFGIPSVKLSREFFNPTLNQNIKVSILAVSPGPVTVEVLDSERNTIRRLLPVKEIVPGQTTFIWDGKNESGEIVSDGVYSFTISLQHVSATSRHFPYEQVIEKHSVPVEYYDRENAILRYQLPKASRVFIEAGTNSSDPVTRKQIRNVIRVIANMEPRTSGSVIESWDGFDETGKIYIPNLPGFFVSIQAIPLPENSVITIGKKEMAAATEPEGQP